MGAAVAPIYVVGTFDTKAAEACFIAEALRAEGVAAVLVDVGTLNPPLATPDIERSKVAAHHPKGPAAVLGHHDRGSAVTAMSQARPTAAARRASFWTYCTSCERRLSDGFFPFCPHCGAMSEVGYDLGAVTLRESEKIGRAHV